MKRTFLLFFLPLYLFAQPSSDLEKKILEIASGYGGRVGVAAISLNTGESIEVNSDSLFPTASVIKLPILVELFAQFHNKEFFPNQPVQLVDSVKVPGSGVLQFLRGGQSLTLIDIATLMIILSDNTATNYIIDLLGKTHDEKMEAVNACMRSIGLHQTKLLNKLYSFATKKKTEEALRFGIGVSSPNDMRLLLEKLARCAVIDSASSEAIIGILRNQQDVQMAARLLPFTDDSTLWIGNKTGSLDAVKNDVGIVSCSRGTYVYAIFCSNSKDEGEQVDNKATLAVAKISKLLFDHFVRK